VLTINSALGNSDTAVCPLATAPFAPCSGSRAAASASSPDSIRERFAGGSALEESAISSESFSPTNASSVDDLARIEAHFALSTKPLGISMLENDFTTRVRSLSLKIKIFFKNNCWGMRFETPTLLL
jgi:hypothetical protein